MYLALSSILSVYVCVSVFLFVCVWEGGEGAILSEELPFLLRNIVINVLRGICHVGNLSRNSSPFSFRFPCHWALTSILGTR